MCSCGGNTQKSVYTSAQAAADAARREKEAIIAATQNANSLQNAQRNSGGK